MTRRLAGVGIVVIGAVGLTVSVQDAAGVRECLIHCQGLLCLCGGPIPEVLFGLWFVLGVVGTFVAARR